MASTRGGPAGLPPNKRDAMGLGMAALTKISSSPVIDRIGLRKPFEKVVTSGVKHGFKAATAGERVFRATKKLNKPQRLEKAPDTGLFSLEPTEEQQMIAETVRDFAAEQLRPAAHDADAKLETPDGLLARAAELGIGAFGIPEELGGFGTERSVVTNVLVAEALAHGDMGLAVSVLAPSAVSTALVQWGDAEQQATYLPAFTGEQVPVAALALLEQAPLFDPRKPKARAKRTPGGYQLDGVKALVPRAAAGELFVVSADLEGQQGSRPALFIVEASNAGVSVEAEPAMGLRGASTGLLHLDKVKLPAGALLGGGDPNVVLETIRLSRLAWCALAAGTGKAVLDYVIPYVNDRVAFGEPISHRQSVAFMVADIAIELESIRLLTLKAAARAEQGKSYAREVALARKLATDKGMWIGSAGVQLLGGHGFTKEHPVERWYRDLRAIGVMEGAVLA